MQEEFSKGEINTETNGLSEKNLYRVWFKRRKPIKEVGFNRRNPMMEVCLRGEKTEEKWGKSMGKCV